VLKNLLRVKDSFEPTPFPLDLSLFSGAGIEVTVSDPDVDGEHGYKGGSLLPLPPPMAGVSYLTVVLKCIGIKDASADAYVNPFLSINVAGQAIISHIICLLVYSISSSICFRFCWNVSRVHSRHSCCCSGP
jgi:hypothetical protein